MSILVVGTVAFDAIETPFGKTDKIVGGAATYICLSSSFFTKKLNLVSREEFEVQKKIVEKLQKDLVKIKNKKKIKKAKRS